MWTEQLESMLVLMVMAALLRASHELSTPKATPLKEVSAFAETHLINGVPNPDITPEQREWADKAVRKYAETQEEKWRRWNEAMFEPSK